MDSVSTVAFCKRKTCPAAEMLLRYHAAVLAPTAERVVAAHLAECDFCGAELFLLTKYPPLSLPCYTPLPMPESLNRLIVTLLGGARRSLYRAVQQ